MTELHLSFWWHCLLLKLSELEQLEEVESQASLSKPEIEELGIAEVEAVLLGALDVDTEAGAGFFYESRKNVNESTKCVTGGTDLKKKGLQSCLGPLI